MPDPGWAGSPPEVNDLRIKGGTGTATTIASGLVWAAEAAGCAVSLGASLVNTAATAAAWQGAGALSSAATVTGLNTGMQLLGAYAEEKPPIATAAAAAYETASSAMIPAAVCQANRDQEAADQAINPWVLGALTPAIVALDMEYFGEHWPHNAGVGVTYSATLSALTAALAVPPPVAPMGASPAAPAAAAEAVAQATASGAAGNAMRESSQAAQMLGQGAASPAEMAGQLSSLASPIQSMSGLIQPLTGLFQAPIQAVQGLSSLPQSMMGSVGGMFSSMKPTDAAAEALSEPVRAGGGSAGGLGAGPGGGGVGTGGYPGAGLTSYTRPTSSFAPESSGRPTGLRPGSLNAAEMRGPTTSAPVGGAAMPMSPAGMLARANGDADKDKLAHARIVVDGDRQDPR